MRNSKEHLRVAVEGMKAKDQNAKDRATIARQAATIRKLRARSNVLAEWVRDWIHNGHDLSIQEYVSKADAEVRKMRGKRRGKR